MKKILVADDTSFFCTLIGEELTNAGYRVRTVTDGASAVANAIRFEPDLVLLDIEMPEVSGLEALGRIRAYESMKRTPVIMITSHSEKDTVLNAIKNGANDYVVKPFNVGVLLAKVSVWINAAIEEQCKFLRPGQLFALRFLKKTMTAAFDSTVKGGGLPYKELKDACGLLVKEVEEDGFGWLLRWAEDQNGTLFLHSLMVCLYMYLFSVFRGFGPEECMLNALGGLLHDIGKIKVPDEILFKPARLDSGELEKARMHVEYGVDILKNTQGVDRRVEDICRSHHEKMDGTGYPGSVQGEEISDSGRMCAITEAYAALTVKNVYDGLHDKEDALSRLRTPRGHLDPLMLGEFEDAVHRNFALRPASRIEPAGNLRRDEEERGSEEKQGPEGS